MENMRKIYLTLLFLTVAVTAAFAQQLPMIKIHGLVVNQETGTPVSGQYVYISIDSLQNQGHNNKVVTDANGLYSDYVPYMLGIDQQTINVSTYDCRGAIVKNTGYFHAGKLEVVIDFSICSDTNTRCAAFFTYSPNPDNSLQVAFYDKSLYLPGSGKINYTWDFGDSTSSTDQVAIHSFNKPGLYNVCLSIKSGENFCSSIVCIPVFVVSAIPGKCETSFTFKVDPSGIGYIFEGYMKNGQAKTWKWDFGDGTTATGQKVSHSFNGTNTVYKICLTTSGAGPNGELCTSVYCQDLSLYIPSPCESAFGYLADSSGTSFTFKALSKTNRINSWIWDFGDGTTGSGPIVSHSFKNQESRHKVCLTTTTSGNDSIACTSVTCQEVFSNIPSPCESFFSYQPDSSGTTYTFSGLTQNQQVDTWTWDFGDGTTATGQAVSHIFKGTSNSYKVCLTATGTNADGTVCKSSSCQEIFVKLPSQCENYFKFVTKDNSTFSFSGNVSSTGPAYYYWNFGDGDTATGQQVTHTFRGTKAELFYNVCLTTIVAMPETSDVFNGCKSRSCQVIYPGGGSACQAVMSATADSLGYTYSFENLSQGNAGFTVWDFGDGIKSTEKNSVHNYLKPGIYKACLTISDSINKCWDETCQEIWVNNIQTECKASFNAFPSDSASGLLSYVFLNSSSPGYAKQKWSFGDGTGSSESKPVHVFATPGVYNACLTIWDSVGNCQDTHCINIFAGKINGDKTIRGIVLAGNTPADQGLIWLVGSGNNYHAETLIDSTGTYSFNNVPAGSFYIYAMLTPGSNKFFGYMPTYYPGSMIWQTATLVIAGEPNAWYPISLVPSIPFISGDAAITGNVNWVGISGSEGSPASNVEIVLVNSAGVPVAYTFSHSDGSFHFSNLPYGDYTLHGQMAGKTTGTASVNLSGSSINANIDFIVNSEAIITTGIKDPGKISPVAGSPYPNPVIETLNIDLNAAFSGKAVVEIIDIQGRSIHHESIEIVDGKNQIKIATGSLKKGIYLLRINHEGQKPVQRKFIK